jgi:hypothetical protein
MEMSIEGQHRQKIALKGQVQMFRGHEDSIIVTNEGSIDKEFDESILQNSMKFQTVDARVADSLDTGGELISHINSNEYSA